MKLKVALKTLLTIKPTENFKGPKEICSSFLKILKKSGCIAQGRALHGVLFKMGLSSERYIAVKILIMYLNLRKFREVDQVVSDYDGFDIVVYNCLLFAKVQRGLVDEARLLFDKMPERNEVSWTVLISGLMKYGRVQESMWYFERNSFHSVVYWTAAISGLIQNWLHLDALKLFRRMLQHGVMPNKVSLTSVVKACAGLGDCGLSMSVLGLLLKVGYGKNLSVCNSLITLSLKLGKIDIARMIFDRMEKRDVFSWTAILDMYVQLGYLSEARRVFDAMPQRNEVSWSVMIARYSQSGCPEQAAILFQQMVQEGLNPTVSCLSSIITALGSLKALQAGMNIHGHAVKVGLESDIFISSSLINFYCKCRKTEDGRSVFDSTPHKNVVSWNSMVAGYSLNGQLAWAKELFGLIPEKNTVSWNAILTGYVENGHYDDAFDVFGRMLLAGDIPNNTTFATMLCACATIASLEKGKQLHGKIIKLGVQDDVFTGTALVDMYAKSGDVESSKLVFNRMPEKNEISWTAMIQGLAENGFAEESILLFEEMERKSSIVPNELMLLAVLSACSHCRLVNKGLWYFNAMERVYGIKPKGRHYTCIVDLLSRSGQLSEAENIVKSMPFQPEADAWAALLSGCNTYKDKDTAERTAKMLSEFAEQSPTGYVLLSNLYASDGRWTEVSNIWELMKEQKLNKSRGRSWIEVRN
ncbi:hypothetical protein Ancab_004042 [Ancistrocladus abbreviatus]